MKKVTYCAARFFELWTLHVDSSFCCEKTRKLDNRIRIEKKAGQIMNYNPIASNGILRCYHSKSRCVVIHHLVPIGTPDSWFRDPECQYLAHNKSNNGKFQVWILDWKFRASLITFRLNTTHVSSHLYFFSVYKSTWFVKKFITQIILFFCFVVFIFQIIKRIEKNSLFYCVSDLRNYFLC